MKINIDRKSLISIMDKGTQMAGKNVEAILETVKIRIDKGKMAVTSYNGAVGVTASADLNTGGDTRLVFCIVHDRLSKILRLIDDEIVSLEIDDEGKTLAFVHDGGRMNIPVLPSDDFPDFGKEPHTAEASLESSAVTEWARLSSAFSASDELRPILSGMYLYSEARETGFCASDSHVLITDHIDGTECPDFSMVIPNAALPVLNKCFKDTGNIRIMVSERSAVFSSGGTAVYCRTVHGKYPNFRSIIPTEYGTAVTAVRKEAVQSLKRTVLSSDTGLHAVILSSCDGRMEMEAHDLAGGASSYETCPCSQGTFERTGLHGERLITAIESLKGDNVTFYMSGPSRPVAITGEGDTRKIVIMPLSITNS